MTTLMEMLAEGLKKTKGLLNIVIADNQQIVAARHAVNGECPSLYYTNGDEDYPDASLIASERLTPSSAWQPVPEHHMAIINANKTIQLTAL